MKKIFVLLAAIMLLPAFALAQIQMDFANENGSQLVVFSAQADMPQAAPGKNAPADPVLMAINMQLEIRFAQEQARKAAARADVPVRQEGGVYQDGKIASMWRTWQGEQADGREGSSAAALTVNLETGMEIYLDELFSDPEAAAAAMEAIISEEILAEMGDYMEYSDLLLMPTNCYSVDEAGLTVYWPQDSYRYFDGTSGSVTFLWHEIAAYIGEDSPVYALSRPQEVNISELRYDVALGSFHDVLNVSLYEALEDVQRRVALGDPDYTTDALVYPLERVRGFSLEVPKYADTPEDEERVSAIRAACISNHGLTTGVTTVEEVYAILGAPDQAVLYDEETAMDALLEPGESLFYETDGRVLQTHFDEEGKLSCLILRSTMPGA